MTHNPHVFLTTLLERIGAGDSIPLSYAKAHVAKSNGAVPLYGCRKLLNAESIIQHYAAQGLTISVLPDDMHVTIVYSRQPYAPLYPYSSWERVVVRGGKRDHELFGPEEQVLVLTLESAELAQEWAQHCADGASWDWESFRPHVTLSYEVPSGFDEDALLPYTGDVVLGPTEYEEIKEKNNPLSSVEKHAILDTIMQSAISKSDPFKIVKYDDDQRVVWGWASVATIEGEPVYDSQGDHIPMDELTKASTKFMLTKRTGLEMHSGTKKSDVVHSMPLSKELASSLGIQCDREGWIIGKKFHDVELWNKVKSGEYPAFSIAGRGVRVDS